MSIIRKMDDLYDGMTDSEKKVYKFIKKDPSVVIQYTIRQIAMMAGTSISAVQRFTKTLGFSGYKDFRYAILNWEKDCEIHEEDTVSILAHSFSDSILELEKIDRTLIDQFCRDLCSADKIILFGRHRNKTVTEKMAMNLTDLGFTCICVSDTIGYQHILYITDSNTCAVIFSALAELNDVSDFLLQLKASTEKRWLITNSEKPKMGKLIDKSIRLPGLYTGLTYPLTTHFIMMAFVEIVTMHLAEMKKQKD